MSVTSPPTLGDQLAQQFFNAIHHAEHAPLPGSRALPQLTGLTQKGTFISPQDNVLIAAKNILVASNRVFRYGTSIVMESATMDGAEQKLVALSNGGMVETGAEDFLSNLFICKCGDTEFPVGKWFADVLLRSELLGDLPRIAHYARRPIFTHDYVLCNPGWDPASGILVHGPAIEPILLNSTIAGTTGSERLPPHLQRLLSGFCFRSDADLANVLAFFLTGMLTNLFVSTGKPIAVIDGNQPGTGKSLMVRLLGVVIDGTEPHLIDYIPNDEEMQKRICAKIRDGRQSIVFIDNAKTRAGASISSPVIEANSLAPEVSLRILGRSENFTRPNDLVWAITMNNTRLSPDLASRGVAVQLAHEGRPENRTFDLIDPVGYAHEHRLDILGELAGLVIRWNQQGRPRGQRPHRCREWAETVGGILMIAGFPEFLENAAVTAAAFNSHYDELAALAEAVVKLNGPWVEVA